MIEPRSDGFFHRGESLRHQAGSGHARRFYRHDGGSFCVSEPINVEVATFGNGSTMGFKCESPEQLPEHQPFAAAMA